MKDPDIRNDEKFWELGLDAAEQMLRDAQANLDAYQARDVSGVCSSVHYLANDMRAFTLSAATLVLMEGLEAVVEGDPTRTLPVTGKNISVVALGRAVARQVGVDFDGSVETLRKFRAGSKLSDEEIDRIMAAEGVLTEQDIANLLDPS